MPLRIGESLSSDSEPIRPVAAVERLYATLSPWCEPFVLAERKIPTESTGSIYFIREGVFSILRKTDRFPLFTAQSSESRMAVFGLVDAVLNESAYLLYPETRCKGFRVASQHLTHLRDVPELWQDITALIAWFSLYATRRDILINGSPGHYRTVRHCLIMLISLPEETRKTINAQRFISERTNISKSSVLRILYELEQGGYIRTQWGKLLEMKYLPKDF